MSYGRTIELLLTTGSFNGMIIAKLANWSGKAIKLQHSELKASKRKDLQTSGICFLFTDTKLYIQHSNNSYESLLLASFPWETAIIFTEIDTSSLALHYLLSRLDELAITSQRYVVCSKQTTHTTALPAESQIAVVEEVIENIRLLLHIFGYPALEPLPSTSQDIIEEKKSNIRFV
jgi:hypothetical protein